MAVLGGTVEIPTLEGTSTIRIAPSTQAQKIIRLSGRGLPLDDKWPIHTTMENRKNKRGDIHYTVHIEVPINLDAHQKKILQQLQKDFQRSSKPNQHNPICCNV